ncbi:hypothetical protein QQS21_002464 [Conoideocrella luteorostrata]|uniref:Zn(2)-C6 fungal-type domain-containing protein n=1 Tax=Conoideocrella luteorostrata TaxID=1105319 RepID=A0AAJ0CV42_9HYPO|nr:hypothetical protein QQS21_002464 [Conoideocrella luteorostrata]
MQQGKRPAHSPVRSAPKVRKVTRACDSCKLRKTRCSGDLPCAKCIARGLECLYAAAYTRGKKKTPPPSSALLGVADAAEDAGEALAGQRVESSSPMAQVVANLHLHDDPRPTAFDEENNGESAVHSRASPELAMAEIQGQVFDPTSSLAFVHRAWKRLSVQHSDNESRFNKPSSEKQLTYMMVDKNLSIHKDISQSILPDPAEARTLTAMYFDVCIATYRFLNRASFNTWLDTMQKNVAGDSPVWSTVGHAKAATVYAALAMARRHQEKSNSGFVLEDDAEILLRTDELFAFSVQLTDQETGLAALESVQARIVQTLYLLTTSRFNQAWYTFGHALRIIGALGWQRRANRARRHVPKPDYIYGQCCLRTFWSAYIIDNYLGVVFGRPRLFHDDDIDQDWPDRVNDEEMTPGGPSCDVADQRQGCHIDSLIFHAKIAKIIGRISRDVYSGKYTTENGRISVANGLTRCVNDWQKSLPAHLGSVDPAMLLPTYRRQATVLKLAHAHAIMHVNRLFLLRSPESNYVSQIQDCIKAASGVLETVDYMAQDGPIFHAFWWTHYVTFCALVVTYIWEIKNRRLNSQAASKDKGLLLMRLAERCHQHLAEATASNSPSRRYAVILEELRSLAVKQAGPQISQYLSGSGTAVERVSGNLRGENHNVPETGMSSESVGQVGPDESHMVDVPFILDDWQLTDWLDLDSSAFWPDFIADESTASDHNNP